MTTRSNCLMKVALCCFENYIRVVLDFKLNYTVKYKKQFEIKCYNIVSICVKQRLKLHSSQIQIY
jgi:hypothetical protein